MRATVRVVNKQGLHARPISEFVKLAGSFQATISVAGPGGQVDARSVLSMLQLQAAQGSELVIVASGTDARRAVDALCGLVSEGFGEP